MERYGEYSITVISAALLCSLILSILNDGTGKKVIRLLCGIFLTTVVLQPLADFRLPDIDVWTRIYTEDAAVYADTGIRMAEDAAAQIIRDSTQAYILEKARFLNGEISVEIAVENGIPISAVLTGNISPYGRQQLTDILEQDLGIDKENQTWM